VTNLSTRFRAFCAIAASLLFFLLGASLAPFAGIQEDEALFAVPLYLYNPKELYLRLWHWHIPLMVMSYVGTLKTFLYFFIFQIWHVTVWSVRLPMVCAGALTVFLFYRFTTRVGGSFAGLCAAFLLATDPIFLVTNTFDWGPVALGHLLLVAGCLSLLRFGQHDHTMRVLAQGFFFLGLGLWNKALMFWILGGLICGVTIFWPEVRQLLTFRRIGAAAAAFLIGALPFVIFNLKHRNATLGENFRLEPASISQIVVGKGHMVQGAMNGSGLLGFLPAPDWDGYQRPASTWRGKIADWIRNHLGDHRRTGFDFVFLAALAAVPWWWRKRGPWFALIFMLVTWMGMAITRGAGAAIHHAVLLWPFPQFFVALVLAALPRRRAATVAAVAMVAMNLLVVNQYLVEFDRDGAFGNFTDAIYRLSTAMPENHKTIYAIDWGMVNSLALLHQGRLTIYAVMGLFDHDHPDETERAVIKRIMEDPDGIFIGHVAGREVFKGVNERADQAAASLGFKKETIQVIQDSHGRPVFEIFRFGRV